MGFESMTELNKAAIWSPKDINELCSLVYGV